MSITFITGALGSGKTAFMVHLLCERYYSWNDKFFEWEKKGGSNEGSGAVTVISNIDNLRLDGYKLDREIARAGSIQKYFNVAYHSSDKVLEGKKVLVIDEVQKLFDRKFFDKDVFYFFQYSRHLGYDIYLITQDVETVSKELRNLAEKEFRAVRRTMQLGPEFRYHVYVDFMKIGMKVVRKDKRVFAAYRSFSDDEPEQVKSQTRKWLLVSVVLAITLVVFVKGFIGYALSGFHSDKKQVSISRPLVPKKVEQDENISKKIVKEEKIIIPIKKKQEKREVVVKYVLPEGVRRIGSVETFSSDGKSEIKNYYYVKSLDDVKYQGSGQ